MRRQELLVRKNPLSLYVVIDESALLRMVGGPEVMRRQMAKLMAMADLPNVNIHVLPLNVHREPVIGESFTLLEFLPAYDVRFPDIIFIDNSWTTAAEFQDDTVTHMYQRSWGILKAASLSPDDSVERIARLEREDWRT